MNKKQCMVCGEYACEYKIKKIPFSYKDKTVFIDQPGEWCDSCGEGVLKDNDIHATMKEMQTHKARVDHLLTPDDIRRIRKKLHFNQKEAAEYFGGGVNGFSRYERGESPPPRSLSSLFIILDNDPSKMELLTKSQSTP